MAVLTQRGPGQRFYYYNGTTVCWNHKRMKTARMYGIGSPQSRHRKKQDGTGVLGGGEQGKTVVVTTQTNMKDLSAISI